MSNNTSGGSETTSAAAGEIGKREFVRALSVDEGDIGGAEAAMKPAVEAEAVDTKKVDLRYVRYNAEVHPAGWWEPSAEHLKVRDINYLKDKKKRKTAPAVFECVEVETFQVNKPLRKVSHMATSPHTIFPLIRKKAPQGTPYVGAPGSGFTFIVNFQAPGYGVVMYFQRKSTEKLGDEGGGPAFESAFREFLEGDEEYKTRHLKFFPVVTEGGWIVRKVVGGKPAIIAKKIDSEFYSGDNYFEVDVDVSSSSVAKNILKVVKSYAKKVTFDLAWGLEGKKIEHLPERIIGIARFEHVHTSLLTPYPIDPSIVEAAESSSSKAKKKKKKKART